MMKVAEWEQNGSREQYICDKNKPYRQFFIHIATSFCFILIILSYSQPDFNTVEIIWLDFFGKDIAERKQKASRYARFC
jgi:hypothetical protein